eukprot:CAMPEP_0201936386 /NCGR_PEP_ID=MMETSP0903-20130614/37388_1 /ASSEMBLY_ACC=CAM_ASM_000552 /TAXON_ID=420261 /ORGANISM="Thalassiosira antarctica, Strain CCMP982" /LENGTH=40 /DNA_ID= /DNA_START= /DNA_END= /DNA_ORIENTATION=
MTAHNIHIQHYDLATRANMIFDETFSDNSPVMNNATTKCT